MLIAELASRGVHGRESKGEGRFSSEYLMGEQQDLLLPESAVRVAEIPPVRSAADAVTTSGPSVVEADEARERASLQQDQSSAAPTSGLPLKASPRSIISRGAPPFMRPPADLVKSSPRDTLLVAMRHGREHGDSRASNSAKLRLARMDERAARHRRSESEPFVRPPQHVLDAPETTDTILTSPGDADAATSRCTSVPPLAMHKLIGLVQQRPILRAKCMPAPPPKEDLDAMW